MKQEAYNELQELAPQLANATRQMPYWLPEGYFDQLPSRLLQQTTADVPVGYFEGLSDKILQKIKATATLDVQETPSVLLPGGKPVSMPYQIPANYFEQLPHKVQAELPTPGGAKVIGMRWVRWAAAACVVGLMVVLGLKMMLGGKINDGNKGLAECTNIDDCLSSVDDQTIQNYLNQSAIDDIGIDEPSNIIDEQEKTPDFELNDEEMKMMEDYLKQAGSDS